MALDRFNFSTRPQENALRPFHLQLGSHRESTARRCPTSTRGNSSRQAKEGDTLVRRPNAIDEHASTVTLQPAHHTVNRARPLARRRARTRRPFLVLMRFRKPCSRFFLRFDGCRNVNDTRPPFDCRSIPYRSLVDLLKNGRLHYRSAPHPCQFAVFRVLIGGKPTTSTF